MELKSRLSRSVFFGITLAAISGCGNTQTEINDVDLAIKSYWLKTEKNQIVEDPQTSGLALWRDQFISIADGSAKAEHQLRILRIQPEDHAFSNSGFKIRKSEEVAQGCFVDYLNYGPDLEALVVDPDDDSVFITVTEDAYHFRLKGECQEKYGDTGSTAFPTLLLRLELQQDNSVVMTHAKPLKFADAHEVGNYPNDGIEGMAFGEGRKLYLGLEKDKASQPRIFSVNITSDFWDAPGMAEVMDEELLLPKFEGGLHPINGMTYHSASKFIFAAARNDNEIWVIDSQKQVPTKKIKLRFLAEKLVGDCPDWQKMNNFSMEGMAFIDDQLWIINDPWKANYLKNAQDCPPMLSYYEKMAPLITKIDVPQEWISRP